MFFLPDIYGSRRLSANQRQHDGYREYVVIVADFHVAVIFMNDRGYIGQSYAAVLFSNLDAFVPVAFYAQLAVVGIGDADDQECLLAADFRMDEPVGPLSHTAACLPVEYLGLR